jgi:hypothetical protein
VEPVSRLRIFGDRIDLYTPPPEQPCAGHRPKRGGQCGRQAKLRGDGAWRQSSRMLRQDVEDQLPERFRGGRQACLRRFSALRPVALGDAYRLCPLALVGPSRSGCPPGRGDGSAGMIRHPTAIVHVRRRKCLPPSCLLSRLTVLHRCPSGFPQPAVLRPSREARETHMFDGKTLHAVPHSMVLLCMSWCRQFHPVPASACSLPSDVPGRRSWCGQPIWETTGPIVY